MFPLKYQNNRQRDRTGHLIIYKGLGKVPPAQPNCPRWAWGGVFCGCFVPQVVVGPLVTNVAAASESLGCLLHRPHSEIIPQLAAINMDQYVPILLYKLKQQ